MVVRARVSSAQVEDVQSAPLHPYGRELRDAFQSLAWDTGYLWVYHVHPKVLHPLPAKPAMKEAVVVPGMKMNSFPSGDLQALGGLAAARSLAGSGAGHSTGEVAGAVAEGVADAGIATAAAGEVAAVGVAGSDEKACFHQQSDDVPRANVQGKAGHGEEAAQQLLNHEDHVADGQAVPGKAPAEDDAQSCRQHPRIRGVYVTDVADASHQFLDAQRQGALGEPPVGVVGMTHDARAR